MLVVPALILAHGRQAAARLSTLAEPAAVIPADRNVDGAATRSSDRYAFAVVDPGPSTTVAAPPASETSITTGTTTPRVVVTVKRTITTTTAPRRSVVTRPPPPTTTVPAHSEVGQASWYNGPAGSCAHPYLPIGTVITVTNVATGASATCRVGGRGPYGGNRIVDLDQATFAKLAPPSAGVIEVRITW
jgi:rare lipoprotein A (peptidoglycan hydrolase)